MVQMQDRHTIESLAAELVTVYEELSVLYTLSAGLGRLTSEDEVAAVALREAVDVARADCGWFVTWESMEPRIPESSRRGIAAGTAERIAMAALHPRIAPASGNAIVHDLEREFGLSQRDAPSRVLACAIGSGRNRSWLCLGRRKDRDIFTSADQKLLAAVAALAGISLENVRLQRDRIEGERLAHELQMARDIQRSLLPQQFRCFPWMDAAGESIPCFEIGGDFYDVIPMNGDECLFVIADVSGKGPAAALRAATVQGNIQALCGKTMNLPVVLETINEAFRSRASDTAGFVTASLAVLKSDGHVRYVNGGHNAPMLIPSTGGVGELPEGGPLIGLLPGASFPQGVARLAPGDLLFFYTDGVTDCENERDETFGLERLRTWAVRQCGRTPDEARRDLIAELQAFSGKRRHPDDLTFLLVQYNAA